ncbi:MAG: class I SAM-dependent rRNA methyltransferase [Clostridiales bacterium]|nr:class I SAM-dependent rRNA methyltransferase [Clostridiales bacterium]
MPYEIYLKKNEERRIVAGHSWVYANEVAKIVGKDKNGAIATVYSHDGKMLGKGFINHASKILVRIFIRDDRTDVENIIAERIHAANAARIKLGYDSCYRAVFAEADDLPALIVDKYGDYLSVQILSLGMYQRKKAIVSALVEEFQPKGIYERSDVAVRQKEGLPEEKGLLYGEVPDQIVVTENGLKMAVDVKNGQKTGYFLDQKENRLAIRRYARGEVLDCFCNSGGFSLNAATVADSVTAVDVSELALNTVLINAELNGFTNVQTVRADVFELLRDYRKQNRQFDCVILDPPAFTKTANEAQDALKGYLDINTLGLKLVKNGGYLVTCSCSHYVSQQAFEKMLGDAVRRAGKRVQCVEVRSQAPDHPTLLSADETHYLKCFVLRVSD